MPYTPFLFYSFLFLETGAKYNAIRPTILHLGQLVRLEALLDDGAGNTCLSSRRRLRKGKIQCNVLSKFQLLLLHHALPEGRGCGFLKKESQILLKCITPSRGSVTQGHL